MAYSIDDPPGTVQPAEDGWTRQAKPSIIGTMPRHACPHCRKRLPGPLVWKTLVAGQTAHKCPACRKRFRLTYAAKRRVAYLNVVLALGLSILAGYAFYWNLPALLYSALAYLGLATLVILVVPYQARYEKTSAPNH